MAISGCINSDDDDSGGVTVSVNSFNVASAQSEANGVITINSSVDGNFTVSYEAESSNAGGTQICLMSNYIDDEAENCYGSDNFTLKGHTNSFGEVSENYQLTYNGTSLSINNTSIHSYTTTAPWTGYIVATAWAQSFDENVQSVKTYRSKAQKVTFTF